MQDANGAAGDTTNGEYNDNDTSVEFEFDITIVGGEPGRRLAIAQANSILEVIEWFTRQPPPPNRES